MDVIMPQLGETVAEGTVTKWYKKVGDTVKADDVLFDVETDKVSTEIPAQANGVLAEILVAEGVTAKVGDAARGDPESGGAARRLGSATIAGGLRGSRRCSRAAARDRAARRAAPAGRLSPVVRRLLAEHTLDRIRRSRGTGRDGRVTREDVLAHIAQRGARRVSRKAPSRQRATSPRRRRRRFRSTTSASAPPSTWRSRGPRCRTCCRWSRRISRGWTQARRAAGAPWKSREGFSLTYLPFIARAARRSRSRSSAVERELRRRSSRAAQARQSRHRRGSQFRRAGGAGAEGCGGQGRAQN